MRVLFLTQVLPYPQDAGPKIRAYYTLRYLAQRHEVTLLSFVRAGDTHEAVQHLRSFCREVYTAPMVRSRFKDVWHGLRSLAGNIPFLIARDWAPEMAAKIKDLIGGSDHQRVHRLSQAPDQGFDVIHADQLWMAPYGLLARQFARSARPTDRSQQTPKVVLDQHNAVFQIPLRLAQWEQNPIKSAFLNLEARKLARFEAETCRQCDHVVWVTEEDRAALHAYMTGAQLSSLTTDSENRRQMTEDEISAALTLPSSVIPICVDPEERPVIQRRPEARRVTFLGGLHWPPNAEGVLWFAREVWPRVLQQVPDAILTVIGKNPPAQLSTLGIQPATLEVAGYVPDPTPFLTETAVFIVPLHAGGGMRVKILDAWSWGLPVVSTTIGAEGITYQDGADLLIADNSEAFAQAVVWLLTDPVLADRLGAAGRRAVETRYDWRRVYRAWDEVYQSL